MKKISTIFDNEEKSNFESTIEIILENGTVIRGTILVRELNESFAKEVTAQSVKNAKIKAVKLLKVAKKK
jgi:hypothetical protein